MILELKCDKTSRGSAYKSLAEEVLSENVEVRALTAKAALKVKKNWTRSRAWKSETAAKVRMQVATAVVRIPENLAGVQPALIQLPVSDANKCVEIG